MTQFRRRRAPRPQKREKSFEPVSKFSDGLRVVIFGWGTLRPPNQSTGGANWLISAFQISKKIGKKCCRVPLNLPGHAPTHCFCRGRNFQRGSENSVSRFYALLVATSAPTFRRRLARYLASFLPVLSSSSKAQNSSANRNATGEICIWSSSGVVQNDKLQRSIKVHMKTWLTLSTLSGWYATFLTKFLDANS